MNIHQFRLFDIWKPTSWRIMNNLVKNTFVQTMRSDIARYECRSSGPLSRSLFLSFQTTHFDYNSIFTNEHENKIHTRSWFVLLHTDDDLTCVLLYKRFQTLPFQVIQGPNNNRDYETFSNRYIKITIELRCTCYIGCQRL